MKREKIKRFFTFIIISILIICCVFLLCYIFILGLGVTRIYGVTEWDKTLKFKEEKVFYYLSPDKLRQTVVLTQSNQKHKKIIYSLSEDWLKIVFGKKGRAIFVRSHYLRGRMRIEILLCKYIAKNNFFGMLWKQFPLWGTKWDYVRDKPPWVDKKIYNVESCPLFEN